MYALFPCPQACIRRRAILSAGANSACPDAASAERAVNEIWESYFSDTRPFDEVHVSLCRTVRLLDLSINPLITSELGISSNFAMENVTVNILPYCVLFIVVRTSQ